MKGKVALISGSSRGIGKAIAFQLAAMGAKVVINYKEGDVEARETTEELRRLGREVLLARADISDPAQVETLFSETEAKLGPVAILINNAGVTRDRTFRKMEKSDWDAVIRVNLDGAFICTKRVVEPMIEAGWGRIINITSVIGQSGNFGQVNYAASKAGLIGMTKALSRELAPKGITVNAIAPGFIATEMVAAIPADIQARICSRITLNRFGTPNDVADMATHLCAETSNYITGQVFNVDGGFIG